MVDGPGNVAPRCVNVGGAPRAVVNGSPSSIVDRRPSSVGRRRSSSVAAGRSSLVGRSSVAGRRSSLAVTPRRPSVLQRRRESSVVVRRRVSSWGIGRQPSSVGPRSASIFHRRRWSLVAGPNGSQVILLRRSSVVGAHRRKDTSRNSASGSSRQWPRRNVPAPRLPSVRRGGPCDKVARPSNLSGILRPPMSSGQNQGAAIGAIAIRNKGIKSQWGRRSSWVVPVVGRRCRPSQVVMGRQSSAGDGRQSSVAVGCRRSVTDVHAEPRSQATTCTFEGTIMFNDDCVTTPRRQSSSLTGQGHRDCMSCCYEAALRKTIRIGRVKRTSKDLNLTKRPTNKHIVDQTSVHNSNKTLPNLTEPK